uniref:Takusan domain-containing protein n=1 Tax=Meloidogyne hapla TaxID=6305 RepID=A0A1I8AZG6_MELHA
MTSSELNMRLEEKLRLLDKIHTLEEADRKNLMKLAKENPSDFNIFQENLNNMVLREKQRLERRVVNMELRERELLDAISYEKARAASVPQLEHKLQQCERLLANYETAQLRLEDDGEDE